jgi:hypothetical protein
MEKKGTNFQHDLDDAEEKGLAVIWRRGRARSNGFLIRTNG